MFSPRFPPNEDDVTEAFDLVIHGGTVFTPGGPVSADIGVRAGKTAAIGKLAEIGRAHV